MVTHIVLCGQSGEKKYHIAKLRSLEETISRDFQWACDNGARILNYLQPQDVLGAPEDYDSREITKEKFKPLCLRSSSLDLSLNLLDISNNSDMMGLLRRYIMDIMAKTDSFLDAVNQHIRDNKQRFRYGTIDHVLFGDLRMVSSDNKYVIYPSVSGVVLRQNHSGGSL